MFDILNIFFFFVCLGNDITSNTFTSSPVLQFALGVGVALATVGMGVYAF